MYRQKFNINIEEVFYPEKNFITNKVDKFLDLSMDELIKIEYVIEVEKRNEELGTLDFDKVYINYFDYIIQSIIKFFK